MGRSVFHGVTIAILSLLALACLVAGMAWSTRPWFVWAAAMLVWLWLVVKSVVAWHRPDDQLVHHLGRWWLGGLSCEVEVALDAGAVMLLACLIHREQSAATTQWLWVDKAMSRSQWLDLRRAVYSRAVQVTKSSV